PRVFLRFSHVVFPRHLMHRHQKESLNLGLNKNKKRGALACAPSNKSKMNNTKQHAIIKP
ncbi:MAG: hypothetical protein JW913_19290, partial [Chitinispirillaceae bacterium]|nr:hypothetical protein [Chitinispirillaceae bacterium]